MEFQAYEQKVNSDLNIIKGELLKYFGEENIIAIILAGGLGRDEKTVLAIQDSEIKILSDYDILVLLSQDLPDTRQMVLRERLSRKIGVSVEIGIHTCRSISRLPPSVFTYELSHHKVLWGKADALEKFLPPIKAVDIPVLEGSRFLFNRGSLLLISFQRFLQCAGSIEARIDLLLGIIKMTLALGDAFLIAEGKYHWSGQKRFELIEDSPMPEDLKRWYRKAWKIKQGLEAVNIKDDVWDICMSFLPICSYYHLSFERKRLGDERLSWCRYAIRELKIDFLKPWNYVKLARMNLRLFGRPQGLGYPPFLSYIVSLERKMKGVLPLLLYARADDTQVRQRLYIACRLLNLPIELQSSTIEDQLGAASDKFGYIWRTFFS